MISIFISYSRADNLIREHLSTLLSETFDDVWYDQRGLAGGDKWWQKIVEQIELCGHFIYLLSNDAVESEWCQKEYEKAVELDKHIIPIQVRAKTNIPSEITTELHLIDMSNGVTVESLNALYKSLIRHSNDNSPNFNYTEAHLEADRKIVEKLWKLVNTRNIAEMVGELHTRQRIQREQYFEHIAKYNEIRIHHKVSHPESVFLNHKLESVFSELDEIIDKFCADVAHNCSSPHADEGDTNYIYHHYWFAKLGFSGPNSDSIVPQRLRDLQALVKIGSQIEEKLAEIAMVIKELFPDFDVNPDGWVNWQ
jgi:hypothetical protein